MSLKPPGARAAAAGSGRAFIAAPPKTVALVRYLGAAPIVVRGAATGHAYQFAAGHAVQPVDARDVAGLVKKGIFRRHA
ncbi:MAG TPA: hypothetical protein VJ833_11495 [Rhodanobacteraceae bacterium]|nr:hypothetical protein [Rhodanobacteraceae bacterium]